MAELSYDSDSNNPSGTFLRDTIRPLLLPYVLESCRTTVVSLQAACGVIAPPKVKADHEGTRTTVDVVHEKWGDPTAPMFDRILNGVLALISRFGCALGGEQFYITCFPFIFWNVDRTLARRVIFLWVTMMYVGQGIKDHLKLPRPGRCNPNVRVLEDVWAIEYGFPSTHVMAILGQVGTLVYFGGWQYDWGSSMSHPWIISFLFIFGVVAWVGFSRIYVGVHSVPDVIGGLFLGLFLLWTFIQVDDAIDNWMVTSPASLYTPSIVCIAILMLYPRPKKFTPCYGDSAMVVGAGNGVISSSWLAQDFTRFPLLLSEMESFSMWAGAAFYRAFIGFLVLGLVRLVFKSLLFAIIPRILPASDRKPTERYSVVVPTKFICYTAVGFSAATVVPLILPFFPTWW